MESIRGGANSTSFFIEVSLCCRPNQAESTGSHPNSEVKRLQAWLVLRWGTAWEVHVTTALFFTYTHPLSLYHQQPTHVITHKSCISLLLLRYIFVSLDGRLHLHLQFVLVDDFLFQPVLLLQLLQRQPHQFQGNPAGQSPSERLHLEILHEIEKLRDEAVAFLHHPFDEFRIGLLHDVPQGLIGLDGHLYFSGLLILVQMDEIYHHFKQPRIRLLKHYDLFFGVLSEGFQSGRVLGDELLTDFEVQPVAGPKGVDIMDYLFLRYRWRHLRHVYFLFGSHQMTIIL